MREVFCRWCGELFAPSRPAQKYCPACRDDPDVAKARARRRKREQREREKRGLEPLPAGRTKSCEICGRAFVPASNRQKWCPLHREQGRREVKTLYMREYRRRKREAGKGAAR